jgi:hemerythrin-like domain-containing protein
MISTLMSVTLLGKIETEEAVMTQALDILHQEHRAIAAVLHCLDHVVDEIQEAELEPDFELLKAIVTYMREFPDQFHHPKEDNFLFPAVKEKAPDVATVVDELHDQHAEGVRALSELTRALEDWEGKPKEPDAANAFCEKAKIYVASQRQHAATEEKTVMPAARKALSVDDWAKINTAFTNNDDPMFGSRPKAAYGKLFSRVVTLAPQPWGMAARHAPPPTDQSGDVDIKADSWSEEQRKALLSLHWI